MSMCDFDNQDQAIFCTYKFIILLARLPPRGCECSSEEKTVLESFLSPHQLARGRAHSRCVINMGDGWMKLGTIQLSG